MTSPYSKIPREHKIRVAPPTTQPITYLPYPNAYNRPSSSIQSSYAAPTTAPPPPPSGLVLNRPNNYVQTAPMLTSYPRSNLIPNSTSTTNNNELNGYAKKIVLQIASIIFGLIGMIVQVVSIIFWRGMISGNVIPTPSFL